MTIGIDAFRGPSTSRMVLNTNLAGTTTGVTKAGLPFRDRIVNMFKSGEAKHGSAQQVKENREFKAAFKSALEKAEGKEVAAAALRRAGLKPGWEAKAKPMSSMQVKLVKVEAAQVRARNCIENRKAAAAFLNATGGSNTFDAAFNAVAAKRKLPVDIETLKDTPKAFMRAVLSHPRFPSGRMTEADFKAVAERTADDYATARAARFAEARPGLAKFAAQHIGEPVYGLNQAVDRMRQLTDPATRGSQALAGESKAFLDAMDAMLTGVKSMAPSLNALLAEQAFTPKQWDDVLGRLDGAVDDLSKLLDNLTKAGGAKSSMGFDVALALRTEIQHQRALVVAKRDFVEDIRDADPLSKKAVAYSDFFWGAGAQQIVDEAVALIKSNPDHPDKIGTIVRLIDASSDFVDKLRDAARDADNQPPERVPSPGSMSKEAHPAARGKAEALKFLKETLKDAGLDPKDLKALTSTSKLHKAHVEALNHGQNWAPIERRMVVQHDGVTRVYQSTITPAPSLNPRMARLYARDVTDQSGGLVTVSAGVSAGDKSNVDHPRNAKLSALAQVDPVTGKVIKETKPVVGHGVLSAWEVSDPAVRAKANEKAAGEILEIAFWSNPRVRNEALARNDAKDKTPIKLTHVSVNLISPSDLREPIAKKYMPDYQEKLYTEEQFEAFQAHTTEALGGPTTILIDDERKKTASATAPSVSLGSDSDDDDDDVVSDKKDVPIPVEVDVISFSFGINGLATGSIAGMAQTWPPVYEHNRAMMAKFVGDPGNAGDAGLGTAGSKVGGFIGGIMEKLDAKVPAQAKLLTEMRERANLIKSMFSSEAFAKGNGDPAKMGREILMLQSMADEALDLLGDKGAAATMSKGCKSDKDRGGVTDVEYKHAQIVRDAGGRIERDAIMNASDRANYYAVMAGSGQIENQQLNTGLGGSKEVGHLGQRVPDKHVREYLSGLSVFAPD